ncbi:MAG: glycosyltransferase family 2 protein [Candidatus Omnitrophica bacterium]|nr:glycosyltransferase family 2 protein [Candidatus Omnitrophota bacterium]
MSEYPAVDIITIGYNSLPFLNDFFLGLSRLEYPSDQCTLFFVDNGSCDGSAEFVEKIHLNFKVEVVRNKKNYGFAKASNMILRRSLADFVGLLNPDTRTDKNWLAALVRTMCASEDVGMASSRRIPQEAPRYINPATQETSWCSGGHCLIRRRALEKVGYFDERFFMYGEDVDLSWRMWLGGYRCVYVPDSICEHHYGREESFKTRRVYYHVRNSILLRYRYGTFFEIRNAYLRWAREGMSLFVKKLRFKEAFPVLAALFGHIPHIGYFLLTRAPVKKKENFLVVKDKWIRL